MNENENESLNAEGVLPDAEVEEQKTHIDDAPLEEDEAVVAAEGVEEAEEEEPKDDAESGEDAPLDEVSAVPKYCTQCGAELEDGAYICTNCGAMVEDAFDAEDMEFQNVVKKGVVTPVRIAAAAVAVIAIVAIVCVALFSGGKTEDVEYIFNSNLALAKQDGLYGYINKSGSFVIEPQFERAGSFNAWGYAVIGEQDDGSYKYGVINKKGETVIDVEYDAIFSDDETGYFWFAEYDFTNYTVSYGLLDSSGNVLSDAVYSAASYYSADGLAVVGVLDDDGNVLYGYADKTGGIAIEPQFEFASSFYNGLAVAGSSDATGIIDTSGEYVIEPQFMALVWSTSENVGLAYTEEDSYCVVDENGEYIVSGFDNIGAQLYAYVSDSDIFGSAGLLPVSDNGKWGFVDKEGEYVIAAEYDDMYPFDESGLAAVCLDSKWGYIDTTGELVIELSFDDAYAFEGKDYAVVGVDGEYGLIDKSGNYIVEPTFDMISETDIEGLFMISEDGFYGVIDKDGNTVLEAEYEYLDVYTDGIIFMENKKYGIMSTKGKVTIEATFDSLNGTDDYCNAEGCENTVSDGEKYCSEHADAEDDIIEDETIEA